jgi:outer membrane protein assembly factor BamB
MKPNKMQTMGLSVFVVLTVAVLGCSASVARAAESPAVQGWLHWRGPQQDGTTREANLPGRWVRGGVADLWSIELRGRGTPVIAGNRVYAWGYRGDGPDLREVLACLDAGTGRVLWEHEFSDYLSDIVYDRYSIGAPTVDAETGNVYLLTTAGDLHCFTPEGKSVWHHAMMERLGRLTFPNGRTGAVSIDADLAIVHVIAANWGAEGPPRDRFYAFDKKSGDLVYSSDPSIGPPHLKDNSFAAPRFAFHNGKRVFFCVTGDGNIIEVNARTGQPLWRFQLAGGGINSSPLLHGNKVIAVHGVENIDSPKTGRMVALNIDAPGHKDEQGRTVLGKDAEVWRNEEISMFSSSPVLVGDRVYQVDQTGVLFCVDANTGRTIWSEKLGTDQIHASPLYGDGKLYVPMNQGKFYILKLRGDEKPERLAEVQLEGNCLGAPAAWDGRVYVFTTERLYCFGHEGGNSSNLPRAELESWPKAGPAAALQILPAEVLMRPGEKQTFRIRSIDANGFLVQENLTGAQWAKFIPPTARVKAEMDGEFDSTGVLVAEGDAQMSAGAYKATLGGLSGTIRGRILPELPYGEDFENYELTEQHAVEAAKFAYPPLPWIGARFKWEVRDVAGQKVLAKTTDNLLLQRAITFLGRPEDSRYTVQADVMSDGNRRGMGEVGLIVQRYVIALQGGHGRLEVTSNQERLKQGVPFKMQPKVWYTLKARVDVAADGSGVIRAKAWPRGEPEPQAWTIEVPHRRAHAQGSPGLFGFSSQQNFRVYVDNISVTPNQKVKP